MEDDLFWISWFLTVAVCGWTILLGWRNPERILAWPFLVSVICLYFYGYMAMSAFTELRTSFVTSDAVFGQFLVLFCLLGINFGWNAGMRAHPKSIYPETYSYIYTWKIGLGLVLLATMVHYSFHGFSIGSRNSLNYRESSAYWYMFFWVGYPGLALSIWALCKMEKAERRVLMIFSLAAFTIFIFPHVYAARRGPLFPTFVILLFVPALALQKKPNPLWLTSGLLLSGFLMLGFVQARSFLNSDEGWSQALNKISLEEVIRTKVSQVGDNEYVSHVCLVGTLNQTGKFQYGTGHVSLLLHWIPRFFWPNKPGLGEGFFWQGELVSDLNEYAGFAAFGGGAAAGGFADSYIQYGYATPMFWFLIGYFFARQYDSAAYGSDPKHIFTYVAILCSSHWLISQGVAAAFVPFLIFLVVPKVVLRFARCASFEGEQCETIQNSALQYDYSQY